MPLELRLGDLSRPELENLILAEHGLLQRVLKAVRDNAPAEWRVRREVEREIDNAYDRRPIMRALVKATTTELDRKEVQRNAARWGRWGP